MNTKFYASFNAFPFENKVITLELIRILFGLINWMSREFFPELLMENFSLGDVHNEPPVQHVQLYTL